nr:tetraketide alpha-pyrone reductase 2-like [Ipomoea batatas]
MDEQEEPKMREYCVTGGTGLIGSYLVKSLLDKGYNLWYAYAKTMAEQEAWKWADEQNGGIELVVVNLSFVVGPLLTPQPTSTLQLILAIVKVRVPHRLELRLEQGLRTHKILDRVSARDHDLPRTVPSLPRAAD